MSLYEQWQKNERLCERLSDALKDIQIVLVMDVQELLENLQKMSRIAEDCVEDLIYSLDDDQYTSVVEMNNSDNFYEMLDEIRHKFHIFEVIKDNQIRNISSEIKTIQNQNEISSDDFSRLSRKIDRLSKLEELDFPF